jgi:hypothetical protein
MLGWRGGGEGDPCRDPMLGWRGGREGDPMLGWRGGGVTLRSIGRGRG